MVRGKWLLFAGVVILGAIAAGALSVLWKRPLRQQPAAAATPSPPPHGAEVSLGGRIEARHLVAVPAPIEGVIEEFFVEVGQEVFEGQLLARIQNESLESARDLANLEFERVQTRVNNMESALLTARLEASRATADASRSRTEYERLQKLEERQSLLHREGATPRLVYERVQKEFAQAQAEYEALAARAKVADEKAASLVKDLEVARKILEEKTAEAESAKSDLEAAEVHSPADGLLIARKGDAGLEVNRTIEDLFRIAVDLGMLQVVLEPEPPVLARLRPDLPVLIFVAEAGSASMPGSIVSVDNGKAVVEFAAPDPAVKPGLTAQVLIRLP
jgi:macrolide-specific efflux system membrane fusion protein